jgi:hypothetical protein
MAKIEVLDNGNLKVSIQMILTGRAGRKRIITPDITGDNCAEPLAVALARAFRWQKYIDDGRFKNGAELALALGKEAGLVARTLRLTLLSPDIVARIISGNFPASLTLAKLRESIPDSWEEQRRVFFEECP